MATVHLRPAVFLDRDGVIIENRADYVRSLAEVVYLPGALAALARLAHARPDWPILIATNQSAVGRGLVNLAAVEAINAAIVAKVRAAGGRIDHIYICPHHPDAGCPCRKPRPGLLQQAAAEWSVDLAASPFIGDALTDIQAGLAAGARPILVRTGLGAEQTEALQRAGLTPPVVADLPAAVALVLDGFAHRNAP